MTLKISWLHEAEKLASKWLHEGENRQAWPTLFVLAFDVLALGVAVWLAEGKNLLAGVLALLLLLLVHMHFNVVFHECCHHAVFKKALHNEALGHVLGLSTLSPFLSRRHAHAQHHARAGDPEGDPTNRRFILRISTMSPQQRARLEVMWRTWVPFLAVGERIGLWLAPFFADRDRRGAATERLAIYLQLATYVILVAGALWFDCLVRTLVLYGACQLLMFVFEELVNLPHHADTPLTRSRLSAREQATVTNSCAPVPIWSRWILLNFNLHAAHHIRPKLPWYELPAAHRELALQSELTSVEHEFAWSFRQRRLPFEVVLREYFEASAALAEASQRRRQRLSPRSGIDE